MERDRKDFFRRGERDTSCISPGEILGGRGRRESPQVPVKTNIYTLVWSQETQRVCTLFPPQ